MDVEEGSRYGPAAFGPSRQGNTEPLEALLVTSPVPMFIGDRAGQIIACNAAALDLLGATPRDVVGAHVTSFDVGRSAARVSEMHEVLEDGQAFRSMTVFQRLDSTRILVHEHISSCIWQSQLRFAAVVVAADTQSPPRAQQEAIDAYGDQGLVLRCAWCSRFYEHPRGWRHVEFEPDMLPGAISHGICADCTRDARKRQR